MNAALPTRNACKEHHTLADAFKASTSVATKLSARGLRPAAALVLPILRSCGQFRPRLAKMQTSHLTSKIRIQTMKNASNGSARFHSIDAVASAIAVSTKTIRRWIEQGDLRAHRFGRLLRVSEEDLIAFSAARRR